MQTHYNAIKTQLGLDEALAPSSEDEKDDYICKYGLVLLIFCRNNNWAEERIQTQNEAEKRRTQKPDL